MKSLSQVPAQTRVRLDPWIQIHLCMGSCILAFSSTAFYPSIMKSRWPVKALEWSGWSAASFMEISYSQMEEI